MSYTPLYPPKSPQTTITRMRLATGTTSNKELGKALGYRCGGDQMQKWLQKGAIPDKALEKTAAITGCSLQWLRGEVQQIFPTAADSDMAPGKGKPNRLVAARMMVAWGVKNISDLEELLGFRNWQWMNRPHVPEKFIEKTIRGTGCTRNWLLTGAEHAEGASQAREKNNPVEEHDLDPAEELLREIKATNPSLHKSLTEQIFAAYSEFYISEEVKKAG